MGPYGVNLTILYFIKLYGLMVWTCNLKLSRNESKIGLFEIMKRLYRVEGWVGRWMDGWMDRNKKWTKFVVCLKMYASPSQIL